MPGSQTEFPPFSYPLCKQPTVIINAMRQQQRQRKLDLANIPNVFVILTKTFLCTISFGGTYS